MDIECIDFSAYQTLRVTLHIFCFYGWSTKLLFDKVFYSFFEKKFLPRNILNVRVGNTFFYGKLYIEKNDLKKRFVRNRGCFENNFGRLLHLASK